MIMEVDYNKWIREQGNVIIELIKSGMVIPEEMIKEYNGFVIESEKGNVMCGCGKGEMEMEELKMKEENMKLREENAVQEDRINCLQKQIDELGKKIISFPDSPIECAVLLISAGFDYETNSLQRAFGAGEKGWSNLYSVSELRQIAEHLLVYCDHNESTEVE